MTFREVLRIDVMRRVWYAQVVSLFGDFLALFAVIAVVSFRMHGTPAQLTGVQIAYMLPIVFVGPRIGLFRSVGSATVSDKWFVAIDFGIGY